jgi:hypothetical protein
MKSLAIVLFSLFASNTYAACNPVTFEGCFCTANDSSGCKPEEPYMPLFKDHKDAEGNYFHMLEGLAIMTLEIQKRIPDFQGFPLSIFLDRQYQDCRNAPGQIYSQDDNFPYMGVCFIFKDQEDAESNYKFGVTTYYQYWDLLQDLIRSESFDCPLINDGIRVNRLWKPIEGCLGGAGTTFLGDKGDVIPNRAMIYNSDQELIATGTNLGNYDGRYRQCFKGKVGNAWGNDPIVIKYFVEGKGEKCFKINNPSQRQD